VQSFDDVPPEGRFLATGRSHPDSRDGPIAAQTWFVYEELRKLLAANELGLEDVVLATVYLADLRDFPVFHRVHRHLFSGDGPAVSVAGFNEVGHRGCKIEIELTAARGGARQRTVVAWPMAAPLAAPAAVGIDAFVFYSGIVGLATDGRLVRGAGDLSGAARAIVQRLEDIETRRGFAAQTWTSFERLRDMAAKAGSDLARLLKLTLYLRDERDIQTFEAVRRAFIADADLPAFECVAVHGPGPVVEAEVQLEAIGMG